MYIKEIKVKSYDVCKNNTIKLSSVMQYFQQIARENLDMLGMTYNFLKEKNIVFVLTKYKIKIFKSMFADEKYIYKTSPCAVSGVSFIRDFLIEDYNSNVFAEASSTWIIIDFEKRTILRPNKLPFEISPDVKLVDFTPERIRTSALSEPSYVYFTKVKYSQLDANNHLNNCHYADIIIDGIYENGFLLPESYEFDISYEHEAALGAELKLDFYNSDNKIYVECNNLTDGSICFSAYFRY